jgi:hypothetical protein
MGEPAGKAGDQQGLFASTRGLLGTGATLLYNRLQLLGVELAEERVRLVSMLAYGGAAFLCIAAGLIFLSILLTVLMWDKQPPAGTRRLFSLVPRRRHCQRRTGDQSGARRLKVVCCKPGRTAHGPRRPLGG